MNNHPMGKEKVPPKVRMLNALTMEVWDIMLKIVLAPKTPKSLCKENGVILILKRVVPQLLKCKVRSQ